MFESIEQGARAGCRPVAATGDAATRPRARFGFARERSERQGRKVGYSRKVGCSYFSLLFGRKGGRKGGKKEGKKEKRKIRPLLARVSRPAGDLVGLGRWTSTTRAEDPRTLAYLVGTLEGR